MGLMCLIAGLNFVARKVLFDAGHEPLFRAVRSSRSPFTHLFFFPELVISCPFITESPKSHLSSRNSASNQPHRNHVQEHLFPHRSLSAQSA
jgi:hypothetical protein